MDKGDTSIVDLKEHGEYLYVDRIDNKYLVLYSPENEKNKIYHINLHKDLLIDYIEELKIPSDYLDYKFIKFNKTLRDNFGGYFFSGIISYNNIIYRGFTLSDGTFKLNNELEFYKITDLITGVDVTSYKSSGNMTYIIGVRNNVNGTNDEVFIKYNTESQTIVEELVFYSDLGDIKLTSMTLTTENLVLICGHTNVYNEDNTIQYTLPYFTVTLK